MSGGWDWGGLLFVPAFSTPRVPPHPAVLVSAAASPGNTAAGWPGGTPSAPCRGGPRVIYPRLGWQAGLQTWESSFPWPDQPRYLGNQIVPLQRGQDRRVLGMAEPPKTAQGSAGGLWMLSAGDCRLPRAVSGTRGSPGVGFSCFLFVVNVELLHYKASPINYPVSFLYLRGRHF